MSPTHILSTLGCLSLCNSLANKHDDKYFGVEKFVTKKVGDFEQRQNLTSLQQGNDTIYETGFTPFLTSCHF